MSVFIGIDPGLSGAVAFLPGFDGPDGMVARVEDTPIMNVGDDDKVRRKYNTAAMAALLRPYSSSTDVTVILEAVHSMPKQGVASSFTFGEGLGMWKGIIAALGLPLVMVTPQRWKKEMLADQGKDKSASRYKAIQLFPALADRFSRVKDDGRAEATLMAAYGRQLRKGN